MGLPRGWYEEAKRESEPEAKSDGQKKPTDEEKPETEEGELPLPPGFPNEDYFEGLICYKCVDSNPWLKRYAGTPGFLPAVCKKNTQNPQNGKETTNGSATEGPTSETKIEEPTNASKKRKADDLEEPITKRTKEGTPAEFHESSNDNGAAGSAALEPPKHKHDFLPPTNPTSTFSLFLKEDFRNHLCHCPTCFPHLTPHPQLREEEETFEPPLSESGDGIANGGGSHGTGSLLDRGEAALSNIDRVRAIEGAMVYNHLRDKVKQFLKPFAESGQAVGAEDIKAYFEKLRGDDQGISEAGGQASASNRGGGGGAADGDGDGGIDGRREQSGKSFLSADNVDKASMRIYSNGSTPS
jgi:E3 ubiquitin-protein ligase UBR7